MWLPPPPLRRAQPSAPDLIGLYNLAVPSDNACILPQLPPCSICSSDVVSFGSALQGEAARRVVSRRDKQAPASTPQCRPPADRPRTAAGTARAARRRGGTSRRSWRASPGQRGFGTRHRGRACICTCGAEGDGVWFGLLVSVGAARRGARVCSGCKCRQAEATAASCGRTAAPPEPHLGQLASSLVVTLRATWLACAMASAATEISRKTSNTTNSTGPSRCSGASPCGSGAGRARFVSGAVRSWPAASKQRRQPAAAQQRATAHARGPAA